MGEAANPTTALDTAAAPAAAVKRKPVVITLNHSLDFATVHGDRSGEDRDYAICFMQDGLPFDAQERLVEKHPIVTGDPKAQAKVEKLRRRAEKLLDQQTRKAAGSDDDEDADDDEESNIDSGEGPIDLKKWAMGATKYRWQLVSDAIVLKLGRRCTSKRDALETMIAEGIVQPGQLSSEHKLALQRL